VNIVSYWISLLSCSNSVGQVQVLDDKLCGGLKLILSLDNGTRTVVVHKLQTLKILPEIYIFALCNVCRCVHYFMPCL
jgi:hypothetical protein